MTQAQDSPGIIAPPPLLYLGTLFIAWLLDQGVHWAMLEQRAILLGSLLLLAGGAFARWSFVSLRQSGTSANPYKPSDALSISGPFAISRNPIYVAMTSLYLGLACLLNTWWALLLLPCLLGLMYHGVILREEAYLERKFGKTYLEYRFRVRRWL